MKVSIDVKDKREGEAIRAGLADPVTRAIVVILGTLAPLSHHTKARVLNYVHDYFIEAGEDNNGSPDTISR